MQKLQLFIIILVVIFLFAGGDYAINSPRGENSSLPEQAESADLEADPNVTQMLLASDRSKFPYRITSRSRVKEIFEKFDMSSVGDIRIYKNVLSRVEEDADPSSAITIYEIQGPKNQGRLSYLNIKLKIIDQKDLTTSINEEGGYGYNSFFYNDVNNPSTGYLFTQIKDELFGFQYPKDVPENFERVKDMVAALMVLL